MKYNRVENLSVEFAIQVIDLYKYLAYEKKEYVLSKQLLRSGTSIGANIKEALKGQSRKDFLSKMYIALKEANETEYWIYLLFKSGIADESKFSDVENKCKELCRLLEKITLTTKSNL